jgi:predicted transcriptional regulator
MAPSQTEIESRVIELAEKSFKTFCGDISGMFGIDMVCSQQQVGPETVSGLKRRFKEFVVVYSVKAEGELDGTFHLVFDRQGLFILAGVVAMHPEHVILENVKFGSLEKADEVSNILTEVGDALVGAWDRVFQKALDGHGRFVQTNTFIGSPWDDSNKKMGLAGHEKLMFVPIEMTVGSYPAFKCGVIFPKAILAGTSESESEAPNVSEGEKETENRAPNVREVEKESKSKAPNVSEEVEKSKPREPTDKKAAEEKTKAEENTKEATQAEGDAVAEKAKPAAKEAIAADKSAAEQGPEAPEEQKPEAAAEGEPEVATEGEPEAAAEEECPAVAVEEPKAAPEEKPEAAAEQKSDDVDVKAPLTAETDKSEKRPISETIQKMARSSAVLPGESAPSVTAEKLPLSSEDALLAVCAKDIMQKNVIWGDPEDSVQKALAKVQQRNAGYMMIGRGQIPEGVVSKSDLTGALSPYLRPTFAKWRRPMDDATLQIKVKWIMSKATCTVTPETPLSAIMEHICKAGRLCLSVVDQQGKVQGLVTVFDIFKVLLKRSRPK